MEAKPSNAPAKWGTFEGNEAPLTIVTHERELHMFQLTEEELDGLHSAGNYKTLDIALLSIAVGAGISLLATLLTVDMKPGLIYQGFVAGAIVSALAIVFFGARALLAWRRSKEGLEKIKRLHQR